MQKDAPSNSVIRKTSPQPGRATASAFLMGSIDRRPQTASGNHGGKLRASHTRPPEMACFPRHACMRALRHRRQRYCKTAAGRCGHRPLRSPKKPNSDLRTPTSDFRLPTSDLRTPTSDFRPPTCPPAAFSAKSQCSNIYNTNTYTYFTYICIFYLKNLQRCGIITL